VLENSVSDSDGGSDGDGVRERFSGGYRSAPVR
jgi:hypothetical protein